MIIGQPFAAKSLQMEMAWHHGGMVSSKLHETRHFTPFTKGYRDYPQVNTFNNLHAVIVSSICICILHNLSSL